MIPVPRYRDGKPDYALQPNVVAVTDRMRHHGMSHIDRLGECRARLLTSIRDRGGRGDYAQIRYGQGVRTQVWLTYYARFEEACRQRHGTRFAIAHVSTGTIWERELFERCGVQLHLISYIELKDRPEDYLTNYVMGKIPSKPRRQTNWSLRKNKELWYNRYLDHRRLAAWYRYKAYEQRENET